MNSPSIDGVLLVDKASGMTSHDVVAIARRALGTKKVGHCGTLDPLATGLLIVVVGRGTKIQDLLMSEDKEYVGTMQLGVLTDSQDADGQIVETRQVPPLSQEQIEASFGKFRGDFYQTPPMVSAIKKEGVPLYKLARQGKTVEREPRFVHVYASCDSVLARSPVARPLAVDWAGDPDPLCRRIAYLLLGELAGDTKDKALTDAFFLPYIATVRTGLQGEENYVRDAMNAFLLYVGQRNAVLHAAALSAAEAIGKVEVDYGDNSCEATDVGKHLSGERIRKKVGAA
jgi:tRNA pseudouridine(55) synthase